MTRSSLSILAAATTLTVAMIGPAASQSGQSITLHVPVELKEMTALGAVVRCSIHVSQYPIGATEHSFPIPNGDFNEVLEIVVDPSPGLSFVDASYYLCRLRVAAEPSPAWSESEEPYVGTPGGSWEVHRIARPDEFFEIEITGPISAVALPPGPGQLQIAPNN